jgi:hypothetical protein
LVRHAIFSGGGIAGYDRSGIDQPLGFFHVTRFYSGKVVLILLGWLRTTESNLILPIILRKQAVIGRRCVVGVAPALAFALCFG